MTDRPQGWGALGIERVGAALLVWRAPRPGDATVALARGLPAEPGRTAVVVDPGAAGADLWPQLASWLGALPPAERASIRLVVSGAGAGASAGQVAGPAQWLADQLAAEVVAPDGAVLPAGGWLFAVAPGEGGGWWAFRTGARPALVGLRHPAPRWERLLPPHALRSASGMVAEPIPAGLWVHVPADPAGRSLADPVFALVPDPARVAVVVGGQGEPATNDQELRELLAALPDSVAAITTVLPYHRVAPAQPVPAPEPPPPPPPPPPPVAEPAPEPPPPPPAPPPPPPPPVAEPAPERQPAPPPPPVAEPAPERQPARPVAEPVAAPPPVVAPEIPPQTVAPATAPPPVPPPPPVAPAPVAAGGQESVVPIDGGVVVAAHGAEPRPVEIAPWWRPDPELFTVAVRFDRGSGTFQVGERSLPAPEFGDLLAAQPGWERRPVLVVSAEMLVGWVVQQLADVLQVAVATGPQDQGRWWGLLPRRADRPQGQVRSLGASYPFAPESLAGLQVPEPAHAATDLARSPEPPPAGLEPGAVLDPTSYPGSAVLRLRLASWLRSAWRPGLFGVAVRRDPSDRITPYRQEHVHWTTWDLANALWALRGHWYGAELALLADGEPGARRGELRLLANYLRVPVSGVDRPLWTASDRVAVASAGVWRDGRGSARLAPVAPADGQWVRAEPRAGAAAAPRAIAPPAAAAGAPGQSTGDGRLDRIIRESTRMPAGRRLVPATGRLDRPVWAAFGRIPARPEVYTVEAPAGAGGFWYGDERLSPAELGRLLAAAAERLGRDILLVTDLRAAGGDAAATRVAAAAGVAVLAAEGPVYVSRDGLLLAAGAFRRFEPDDGGTKLPAALRQAGVRDSRIPNPDALAARQRATATPPPEPEPPPAPPPVALPTASPPAAPPSAVPQPASQRPVPAAPPPAPPPVAPPPPPPASALAAPPPVAAPPPPPASSLAAPPPPPASSLAAPPVAPPPVAPPPPPPSAPEPAAQQEPAAPAPPAEVPVHATLSPTHRSTPEERRRLRAALEWRYDMHARTVSRLLSQRPGLRSSGDPEEAVVTDLVAVRAYLTDWSTELDTALRSGGSTPHPAVACVVSGLRRLASFRGATFRGGELSPGQIAAYHTGAVLTERAFLLCTVSSTTATPGNTEYVIWSATGRRAAGLDVPDEADAVLFAINLRFKVLAVTEPNGGPARVYLRELPASRRDDPTLDLTDDDRTMLHRLQTAVSSRDEVPADQRPRFGDPTRPAFALGLDDAGRPFALG